MFIFLSLSLLRRWRLELQEIPVAKKKDDVVGEFSKDTFF